MESIQNFFKNSAKRFRAWVESNPLRAGLWVAAIVLFVIGLFIPVNPPHVALSGEPIFSTGPAWLTNSVITTIIVDVILILTAVLATARMSLVPSGLQNFMEMTVEFLYNLAESVAGSRARQFFPFVATIFLFVLLCNWSGLIPGVGSIGYYHNEEHVEEARQHAVNFDAQLALTDSKLMFVQPVANELVPLAQSVQEEDAAEGEEGATAEPHAKFVPLFRAPSADLNMTFALAITTVIMVQVWGVRTQGGAYFSKFLNASGKGAMKGISVFVSFLEIISEFSRILAFGFRLFGNIFAGEVVLATMAFLIPFFLPLPFYALEIFVGVIQALVFTMLALVFFTMATIGHGHEEHDTHVAQDHARDEELPGVLVHNPPVA
jgi:F-type H+-transporting ATPase subunit a